MTVLCPGLFSPGTRVSSSFVRHDDRTRIYRRDEVVLSVDTFDLADRCVLASTKSAVQLILSVGKS